MMGSLHHSSFFVVENYYCDSMMCHCAPMTMKNYYVIHYYVFVAVVVAVAASRFQEDRPIPQRDWLDVFWADCLWKNRGRRRSTSSS